MTTTGMEEFVLTHPFQNEALQFIDWEKDRVLVNFTNGITSKEHTLGSLNTLYQMASYVKDKESMTTLWETITKVKHAKWTSTH
jgi:hypothetical protein